MTKTKRAKAAARVAQADKRISDKLGEHRDRAPVRLLSRIGKLGDQPELRLISGGIIGAGLLLRRGRLARAGLRMLVAHELATAAKDFIKLRIDRKRPRSASSSEEAKPRPGHHTAKDYTSFPSGHSAGSVAVAQAFAREFPEYRAAALAAAATVGVAQVPKSAHYPSDVAAGSFIGASVEALLGQAWPAPPVDKTTPSAPPPPPRA